MSPWPGNAKRVWSLLLPLAVCVLVGATRSHAATVRSVELRSDVASAQLGRLMDLLAVRPGDPLEAEALRRSLRNLHASGLVGRARVQVVPVGTDLVFSDVIFSMFSKLRVASLEISGDACVREAELRKTLPQKSGTALSESGILRGVYRMQDLLESRGYLDARVVVGVQVKDAAKEALVSYKVSCGSVTRVGSIVFSGEFAPLDAARLESHLRMASGDRFERRRLGDEVERLERWLARQGYRSSEVDAPTEVASQQKNRVDLEYRLVIGPRIELRASGVDLGTLRKRGLLKALEDGRFDQAALDQAIRGIRTDFQKRGHYRVSVGSHTAESEGDLLVSLFVDPGPLYTLKELELSGNQLVGTSALLERIATSRTRLFAQGSGRLVDEVLDEDLANLRAFYALEGFAEARIGPAVVAENGTALAVEIPIVEGPRRRVVDVSFPGAIALAPESREFPIKAGGPFHPRRVEDTAAEVRAWYEDAGYLSAQVAPKVSQDDQGRLASVAVEVLEGPRVTVDRVIVRGNIRTKTDVIRRSIRLESGDPVSRRRLLAVQRDLYRLGIFSRAEVRLAPAMPFASRRDVLVRVEEGRPQKGSIGFGYDSEDGLRTLLGYSHSNLFGSAVAARFDLRLSEREQQARLLVRQPHLGRFRMPVTYSLFGIEQQQESFDSKRRGFQINTELDRQRTQWGLLLTLKEVKVENPDPALEALEIERELREVDISSLTPRFFTDRRDDPLVPQRGWTLSLQTEYAFPSIGGTAEFAKVFGQQTSYLSLGRLGTLAGSVRIGAIEPLGTAAPADPTVPAGLESAAIPISERFFAGGRTTHRAYRRDLLGVPGETLLLVGEGPDARRVPIGGNGLLLFNLDYRFPIVGAVGGTVFVDAGNVFGDWQQIDPGESKLGAGVGMRYLSPIGPLRLEVGWKVDREPDQSEAVVLLSFGNPF